MKFRSIINVIRRNQTHLCTFGGILLSAASVVTAINETKNDRNHIGSTLLFLSSAGLITYGHLKSCKIISGIASLYAYSVIDKEKLLEEIDSIYGEGSADEIEKSLIEKDMPSEQDPNKGKLYYDSITRKWLTRTPHEMANARYEFNKIFAVRNYARVSEYADLLSIEAENHIEREKWEHTIFDMLDGVIWIEFEDVERDDYTLIRVKDGPEPGSL